MPALSIPQLSALALAAFAVVLLKRRGAAHLNFAALAAVGAALAATVSLRFDFGFAAARFAQATLAAMLPALAWTAFDRLAEPGDSRRWTHFIPAAVMPVLLWQARPLIDPFLALLFASYGAALLWLWRKGPDALAGVALAGALPASRALLIIAIMLLGSAAVDVAIALDLGLGDGEHVTAIIGLAQLAGLVATGIAAFVAGRAAPEREDAEDAKPVSLAADDERRIVAAVDDLLINAKLYREPNLTLIRIARKSGIPARQVSAAINRAHGRNVSQHVNALRIAEACRLLRETGKTVTDVMFEAGFQTKSNFNREFRRVTGKNPTEWRGREP